MNKLPSLVGFRSSKRLDSIPGKPTYASDNQLHRERNTLVVLGCLAEKLGLLTLLHHLSFSLFFNLQLVQPVLQC